MFGAHRDRACPCGHTSMDCGLGFSCEASPPAVANGRAVRPRRSRTTAGLSAKEEPSSHSTATGHNGCTGSPVTCTAHVDRGEHPGRPAASAGRFPTVVVLRPPTRSFPLERRRLTQRIRTRLPTAGGRHRVHGYTEASAIRLWTARRRARSTASPAGGARQTSYVSALSGDLQVFDAATGAERWTGHYRASDRYGPRRSANQRGVRRVEQQLVHVSTPTVRKSCSDRPKTLRVASHRSVGTLNGPPAHEVAVDKGTVYVGGFRRASGYSGWR